MNGRIKLVTHSPRLMSWENINIKLQDIAQKRKESNGSRKSSSAGAVRRESSPNGSRQMYEESVYPKNRVLCTHRSV
jgi:hypothetical protein